MGKRSSRSRLWSSTASTGTTTRRTSELFLQWVWVLLNSVSATGTLPLELLEGAEFAGLLNNLKPHLYFGLKFLIFIFYSLLEIVYGEKVRRLDQWDIHSFCVAFEAEMRQ